MAPMEHSVGDGSMAAGRSIDVTGILMTDGIIALAGGSFTTGGDSNTCGFSGQRYWFAAGY